jgi:hypothetical protein
LGVGLLEKGEVGISATNRNYKGRMGHPEAVAYLASPAVVAASAVKGQICGPDSMDLASLPRYDKPVLTMEVASKEESKAEDAPVASMEELLPGFPESFKGPMVFAPQDNLTTDGMYPGKYTYQDDITPERQAEVVMGESDGVWELEFSHHSMSDVLMTLQKTTTRPLQRPLPTCDSPPLPPRLHPPALVSSSSPDSTLAQVRPGNKPPLPSSILASLSSSPVRSATSLSVMPSTTV